MSREREGLESKTADPESTPDDPWAAWTKGTDDRPQSEPTTPKQSSFFMRTMSREREEPESPIKEQSGPFVEPLKNEIQNAKDSKAEPKVESKPDPKPNLYPWRKQREVPSFLTPEPETKEETPVVPFSWQVIPEIPQAEQTPELEDKYKPTLLETPDTTAPWRRAKSPQAETTEGKDENKPATLGLPQPAYSSRPQTPEEVYIGTHSVTALDNFSTH
ncbi:uncharacterized protein LOC113497890 [Trichoplusia ni]|uniref:Uncharacterized protein LOC113497890 n=1 Tax=Trichoplusia ni TaxID=7111 RepID=A0A7E5VZG1_TRINI|nr:uncharacterized protein LOC113497890 [Trichoplusia ni]XP_026733481.1 uncharacterized protein LOC113497890 [Trichoplusia ni]